MQQLLEFADEHPYDFYGSRNGWTRSLVLAEHDSYAEMQRNYQAIRLAEVYPLPRLRLHYLFDYGDKWMFAFKNPRKVLVQSDDPRILEQVGANPKQYPDINGW